MNQERGMAVVMALLLVALSASAASLVLWQQSLWWQQVEADRQRAQVRLLLDAQFIWASLRLRAMPPMVVANQPWARPWVGEEGGYRWRASLIDLQSRFNLNALGTREGLYDKAMLASYRRLLGALQLPGSLVDSLVEWSGLREAGTDKSSQVAVRIVRDWRELSKVPGYTPAVQRVLAPYVTLLPREFRLVNLNTASPQLLSAMLPNIAPEAMALVARERTHLPLRDVGDLYTRLGIANREPPKTLSSNSSVFLLQGLVHYHRATRRIDVVLALDAGRTRVLTRLDPGALPPPPLS